MKIAIFVSLCLLSISALSGGSSGDYKQLSWVNVEHGHIYITTTPGMNVGECTANEGSTSILKIDSTRAGFDQLYSMVLAAYMSKSKIKFWVSGCGNSPWGIDIPLVYSAQLSEE